MRESEQNDLLQEFALKATRFDEVGFAVQIPPGGCMFLFHVTTSHWETGVESLALFCLGW